MAPRPGRADRRGLPRPVRVRRHRQPARTGSAAAHAAAAAVAAVVRQLPDAFELVGLCRPRSSTRSSSPPSPCRSSVLVASAAGFGLARLPRRPRRIVAGITIAAAMVPTTALLVGRFGLFRALGITDTLLPLMAPALLGESPFHVLFYLWAFRRISARDLRRRPASRAWARSASTGRWPCRSSRRSRSPSPCPASSTCGAPTSSRSSTSPIPTCSPCRWGSACWPTSIRRNQPLLLAGAVTAMAPVVGVFLLVQRRFLGGAAPR